jgi:hypothetical protein
VLLARGRASEPGCLEAFVSVQDYRINAEVRRLLVSRWVDVVRLQVGTTNGVVYLIGSLGTSVEEQNRREDDPQRLSPPERTLHLAKTLEKDIRRIREVRDVVFKLDNVYKRGGRWRLVEPGAEARESRR